MNKFLLSGLLAVGALVASQQTAQAWFQWKFSAGVNMQWQSANNNWLWGALRDGNPTCDNGPGYNNGHPGYPGAYPGPGYGHDFPFFGTAPVAPGVAPGAAPAAPTSTPAQQTNWYGGNPYSTVGYNPYAYPNPYYPASYGHHHYAPSYWYGR